MADVLPALFDSNRDSGKLVSLGKGLLICTCHLPHDAYAPSHRLTSTYRVGRCPEICMSFVGRSLMNSHPISFVRLFYRKDP